MNDAMLVDWITYRPVGHAIEGLHVASAYAAADPRRAVSVALNARSPVELVECCPWLDRAYAVDFDVDGDRLPPDLLAGVPREWDWALQEYRRRDPDLVVANPQVGRLAAAADEHYRPRRSGVPEHVAEYPMRLVLPADAHARADDVLGTDADLVLSVLPTGGGRRTDYPSLGSWLLLIDELTKAWPQARFVVLGKSPGGHRRSVSAMPRAEADRLVGDTGAINARDLPLLVQLALVQRSRLLLSPHSGFGFAALAVGTPWLTLSGGEYYEYFHIGTPFHSLLPDTARYPAFVRDRPLVEDDDGSGPRDPAMTRARVVETMPDLLGAAEQLIERKLSYEDCLAGYFPRLLAALDGDCTRMASWERIHHRYI